MPALSAAQHAAYEARGYLAPLDALPPEQAVDCRRQLEAALAPRGGRPDARFRNKPHLLWRWAADVVRGARILDTVEALLGPDLLVLHTTLFVKTPHDRSFVAWHQDRAYWDLSSDRVVTAWVALTDSTLDNGCVRVVPGSHLRPLLPHRLGRDPDNRLIRGQTLDGAVGDDSAVALELRAGQMSLHHAALLHSSPSNPSASLRAGLAVRYIAPDVRQGGPRHSASLVRGRDRIGYYAHEAEPRFDYDPIARRWHTRSLRRYAVHVAWQALRQPSLGQLALIARLAARADMLRALWR